MLTSLELHENMHMGHLNTLRLPCIAEQYCRIDREETLELATEHARKQGLNVQILGGGSNVILPPMLPGLTIHMGIEGTKLSGTLMTIGAGTPWHASVKRSLLEGLYGLENLALIPGSTGAAPVQNIGAYGRELAEVLQTIEAFDLHTGTMTRFSREQCAFGYRDSIFKRNPERYVITRVTLSLQTHFEPVLVYQGVIDEVAEPVNAEAVFDAICRIRQRKLPEEPNVGSFFKNPVISQDSFATLKGRVEHISGIPADGDQQLKLSAAQLIDMCGLKGEREGDALVSPQHSLVIINTGTATMQNVLHLADRIQRRVFERCGVLLETEPQQLTSIRL